MSRVPGTHPLIGSARWVPVFLPFYRQISTQKPQEAIPTSTQLQSPLSGAERAGAPERKGMNAVRRAHPPVQGSGGLAFGCRPPAGQGGSGRRRKCKAGISPPPGGELPQAGKQWGRDAGREEPGRDRRARGGHSPGRADTEAQSGGASKGRKGCRPRGGPSRASVVGVRESYPPTPRDSRWGESRAGLCPHPLCRPGRTARSAHATVGRHARPGSACLFWTSASPAAHTEVHPALRGWVQFW